MIKTNFMMKNILKDAKVLINQSINNNIFYFHQCTLFKEILT